MNNKTGKIIYIMGYGRSGSTLLDIILGNHPEIQSLGEVAGLYSHWIQGGYCSCSKSYDDCDYWSNIRKSHASIVAPQEPEDIVKHIKSVEGIFSLPFLALGLLPSSVTKPYKRHMTALFRAFTEVSGKITFVDSSKSARAHIGRPLAMKKICSFNVKVILLIRDGKGIMYSRYKGKNQQLEFGIAKKDRIGPLLAVVHWLLTNIFAVTIGNVFFKGETVKVKYENLIIRPSRELSRIGRLLGVNLDEIIERIEINEKFSVPHISGGNRLRKEKSVTLKKNISCHEELPFIYQLFYLIFIWPIVKLFGFDSVQH